MPKCGSNQECLEDSITLADLEDDDCVSFSESQSENGCVNCEHLCVSCNTVTAIRNDNKKAFDKDPINKLFGKPATRSQTKKLRELMSQKCNIDSKEPEIELLQEIYEFPEKNIITFAENIKNKMNEKQLQVYAKYIDFLQIILKQIPKWNTMIKKNNVDSEENLEQKMKQDMLMIILESKIPNIGFAHHPRHVLTGCYAFLQHSSSATKEKVAIAFQRLVSQTGCFEGVLSLAENIFYNE